MTNFTPEMIEKAKTAKSAEELLALAKENNIELTAEKAKTYFEQLNPKSGELSDGELDNVAGGGCATSTDSGKYTVVTSHKNCFNGMFVNNIGEVDGWTGKCVLKYTHDNSGKRYTWALNSSEGECGHCAYLDFNGGIGYCRWSRE